MNTIGSVYYGWAWLIVAGAGSYYFAKRSINKDRDARYAEQQKKKMEQNRLRTENELLAAARRKRDQEAEARGERPPKREADEDGEIVKGAKELNAVDKPRWEATQPYRSPKGDRFSGFK
ncbi:MAG: hypothetical protein M1828_002084 [Chrysothrix sp. TS-e1954]|nr:MAG: hypothetical protein M1828_002084 [Chrysothrix sp. TS-e1954]